MKIRINKVELIPNILQFLFGIYIFLSYFETYLTKFIGSTTKFYLLGLIFVYVLIYEFDIYLNKYSIMFISWFLFKCSSILWSNMSNTDVSTHFLSQIGMVLFLITMTGYHHSLKFLNYILKANYWCSFLFGILSIIFKDAYISEVYATRQVLTLFGLQNDPNNCAAFLCVGLMIALYSMLYEQKKYILNFLVMGVNLFALLLTTSRAGLVSIGVIAVLTVLLPVQSENSKSVKNVKILLIIIMVALVAIYIVLNYLPQDSFLRLFDFKDYEGGSGRTQRWNAALDVFKNSPIVGGGWGGYKLAGFGSSSAIHNTFLTSLCDCGIIGTILLLAPIGGLMFEAVKRKNNFVLFLLICGLVPSFFIDAINKRFFWNAIVISIMLINYQKRTGKIVPIWKEDEG